MKYWGRAMCWEYWRCYPNPGIGRHNTVVAVGRENITINISHRLEGLSLKEGVRGGKDKSQVLYHARSFMVVGEVD